MLGSGLSIIDRIGLGLDMLTPPQYLLLYCESVKVSLLPPKINELLLVPLLRQASVELHRACACILRCPQASR